MLRLVRTCCCHLYERYQNHINQLHHASLYFICTTLFLPCICKNVVSTWAFIAFRKFQISHLSLNIYVSVYVSFAHWIINERCNNAGIIVLTWKAKASPHMRRRASETTLSSFPDLAFLYAIST